MSELRKRAMYDPQSRTQKEWDAIHKVAFSVPKKDFSDDAKDISPGPKQKRKNWW